MIVGHEIKAIEPSPDVEEFNVMEEVKAGIMFLMVVALGIAVAIIAFV